jgi:flagellar hook protein FlgE
LTNLIVAERGFQADSKVISTSDTILQTLVNMTG